MNVLVYTRHKNTQLLVLKCSTNLYNRGQLETKLQESSKRCFKDGVHRGQVLAKPKSVTPHTEFTAEVYILKKEEGGRHTPFFSDTNHNSTSEQQTLQEM